MARLTLRHRLARVHPFVWVGVAALAGGMIAWPLGGWDTVELESTKIPVFEPGEVVPGQQYSVQVDSAEVTDVHPDGYSEPEPGWEYLIMRIVVTNETDQTQLSGNLGAAYSGVVTVDDGAVGWGTTTLGPNDYEVRADPYLIADGTFLPGLQPRLPAPIELVWEVRVGTFESGDEITVGVVDRTPYDSIVSTGTTYLFPTLIATVDLRLR